MRFRFHTTMVLTQPALPCSLSFPQQVSIPLWFLRNSTNQMNLRLKRCWVSIPLWFLRNRNHNLELGKAPKHVSIPLWFLRNLKEIVVDGYLVCKRFPYHYGSYATYVKGGTPTTEIKSFHTTMVLTQQDFRTNDLKVLMERFHTTMVLTQRVIRIAKENLA